MTPKRELELRESTRTPTREYRPIDEALDAIAALREERDAALAEVERLKIWSARGWCSPGAQCGQEGCRRCD